VSIEVECTAKGKARTRYGFGVKVSIAVTNARADGGQFVLGIRSAAGPPCDGHTLKDQNARVEGLTGVTVARAYVDKGHRGHALTAPDTRVTQNPGDRTPTIKRELRRRGAIEPVIGHAKSDGPLERDPLAGAKGDAINAILVGAEHNIRLLLAWSGRFLSFLWAVVRKRHEDTLCSSTVCDSLRTPGEPCRHPELTQSLDDGRNVAPCLLREGWRIRTTPLGVENRAA
jgi:transposase, IS5 family